MTSLYKRIIRHQLIIQNTVLRVKINDKYTCNRLHKIGDIVHVIEFIEPKYCEFILISGIPSDYYHVVTSHGLIDIVLKDTCDIICEETSHTFEDWLEK